MKITADCHLRINEVTHCGCVIVAMVRTDTAVPVTLEGHPVFESRNDNFGESYDYVTHYAIDLTIGGKPAAGLIPANSSVELWVPTTPGNTACELPGPSHGYVLLRHLVDGVKAMPWQRCPEHGNPDNTNVMIHVVASAEPGERPEMIR